MVACFSELHRKESAESARTNQTLPVAISIGVIQYRAAVVRCGAGFPACRSQDGCTTSNRTLFSPFPLFMMENQPAKFHTSRLRERACLPSGAIRRA
jgi:hypothetical protein